MSLLFYRGAGPNSGTIEPLTEPKYASYLKKAKSFKKKVPARLSFEEIIRNKTLPPCSLDDFIDYLVYVEHSAENLQFFLWYCEYVERWSQLPEREREASPVWNTSKKAKSQSLSWSARLEERTYKLDRILTILDRETTTTMTTTTTTPKSPPIRETESRASRVEMNFSRPRTPAALSGIKEEAQVERQWQPFSAQPFRDEVTQVVRHYISASGPRKLNLTEKDRTACMYALQHTTHPSAFLPAFLAAEAVLQGHSHPNFIQWNICNSNHPRMLFARAVGVILIALALILDLILILSKLNRLVRLSALPLWYIGLYILLIGGRGVSTRLYMDRKRQLRPWEKAATADLESTPVEPQNPTTDSPEDKKQDPKRAKPPRKESLQPFGPANDFEGQPWVRLYQEKPLWQKVFDVSVVNHNRHLRALQDRAVFTALLWASLLVVVLTVGSVLIPSANLF